MLVDFSSDTIRDWQVSPAVTVEQPVFVLAQFLSFHFNHWLHKLTSIVVVEE